MQYTIRRGVPIPRAKGLSGAIKSMGHGDCIDIPAAQQMSVHSCARSVGARVKTRGNGDGTVTVWRTDSAAGSGSAAVSPAVAPTSVPTSIFDDAPTPTAAPAPPTTLKSPKRSGYYRTNQWSSRFWTDDLDAVPVTEDTIFE